MPFAPRVVSLAVLAVCALAAGGCDDGKKASGAPAMPPPEVSTVTVTPKSVAVTVDLPGRTVAYRVAEVRPQVGGIILKRLFKEGSEVKEGQQLYQIDPAPYQATLASAQADLAKARATLKSVEAKASRYAELVQINAVSRQDYDDAVASLDQARAQILASEASVRTAQINLAYTKVYAPISGRIGRSASTEGALVTAGQSTNLATITQLDPIYVDVSQSSSDLLRMRREASRGQQRPVEDAPVQLLLDGTTQVYDQPGRLQFSEVTVDQTTGAVQVRAVFPNSRHDLYPGLFVRARVEQGMRDNALLVPQRALVRNADGSTVVWVVGAESKVAPRPVKVGPAVGDSWLIEDGLADGDVVVTEGLQKIRPGMPVRLAAAPGAAPAAAPAAAH